MDDHPLAPGGGVRLTLQPVTITEAQAFVERHHRHHKAPQGGLFAVGVGLGDVVRGVAVVGRPLAHRLDRRGPPTHRMEGDVTDPLPESELSAIAARADAATPGPWFWADEAMYANAAPTPETRDDAGWDWRSGQPRQIAPIRLIETDSGYYPPREKDRAFLAAARSDVPALVAEVRRLRALLAPAPGGEGEA